MKPQFSHGHFFLFSCKQSTLHTSCSSVFCVYNGHRYPRVPQRLLFGSTQPPQRTTPKLLPPLPTKITTQKRGGVLEPRCYGCGRCIAVCPPGIIRAEKYKRSPSVVRELLEKVDGVEIHTKVGDTQNTLETLHFEGG